jgi:hypothetical protein
LNTPHGLTASLIYQIGKYGAFRGGSAHEFEREWLQECVNDQGQEFFKVITLQVFLKVCYNKFVLSEGKK